jgi:HK97 family phage portal protein
MASFVELMQRVAARFTQKADGDVRAGPWYLPITGGWLSADVGSNWNWWQMGGSVIPQSAQSAIVEACVSAYSQTCAMCPGDHWRSNEKGGRDRVTNSALSRILRRPNDYQTMSDFLLNMVRMMYLQGNSYAVAIRNQRYEISELHVMNPSMSWPQLATTGDVFYRLVGNHVIDYRLGREPILVPARDVLHFRLHTSQTQWPYPLVGETPLVAAMGDVSVMNSILKSQIGFYQNQARPSAVLSTDLVLDKDQVQSLRDRWNDQTKALFQGGTPILTAGLKVQPWTVTGKDAALAEVMQFTDEHIALCFRVPRQILGIGSAAYSSTEVLMQSWIATGLGFCLNHIEEAFGQLFGLAGQPDDYVEFSTNALLRSSQKDRIEALARGVQGGIYAPNEARNQEGLDDVPFGQEPRVQQQVVPLSAAGAIPAAPGPAAPHAPPPAAGPATAAEKPISNDNATAVKTNDIQRASRAIVAAAARSQRRRIS